MLLRHLLKCCPTTLTLTLVAATSAAFGQPADAPLPSFDVGSVKASPARGGRRETTAAEYSGDAGDRDHARREPEILYCVGMARV